MVQKLFILKLEPDLDPKPDFLCEHGAWLPSLTPMQYYSWKLSYLFKGSRQLKNGHYNQFHWSITNAGRAVIKFRNLWPNPVLP